MKKAVSKQEVNFFQKNKEVFIIGGSIVVLAGVGFTWYYLKKKEERTNIASQSAKNPRVTTIEVPSSAVDNTSSFRIRRGSRHPYVKILQRYLKMYKEDIGRSGANRDGVDGIFGPKTEKAAKNRLGKTVFTKKDIDGMRDALKMLGK